MERPTKAVGIGEMRRLFVKLQPSPRTRGASTKTTSKTKPGKPIAKALVEAHKRGVKVFVVADKTDNSKGYTAVTFLANEGVPVRLNGRYAILHSKFMVIDNTHLQLGSFNYTAAAVDRNEENVLLLRNVAPLAQQYVVEWKRLWEEGNDLPRAY